MESVLGQQYDQERLLFDQRGPWERFFFGYPVDFSRFDDAEQEGIFVGRPHHYIAVIITAVAITMLRGLFNRFVAIPLGRLGGIREKPQASPVPNEKLEAIFATCRSRPKERHVEEGVAETGLPKAFVHRWFEKRRRVGQPTQMAKFCEETWRLLFYFGVTVYGFVALWDKSWFWDPMHCWYGLGYQPFPMDIRIYYCIQSGMYLSLLASLSTDNKRKDFWEHVIHHTVTLLLMGFSYVQGYYRIGSLVLIVHDFADVFLESAKAAHNLKYQATSEALFIIFAVAFCVSRIVAYPLWVLRSVAFDYGLICVRTAGLHWFYLTLLCTLQVLHFFWFRTIAVMAYKFFMAGKLAGDARSDEELEESDEAIDTEGKQKTN